MDWERITQSWKAISAGISGIVVAGGVAFGGMTYTDTQDVDLHGRVDAAEAKLDVVAGAVERIQNNSDLKKWQYLNDKGKNPGLTLPEYQEFCALGNKLFAGYSCPPYDQIKIKEPNNG